MVAPNSEYVEYDIRLQAREAITQLQTLTQTATTFGERVAMVRAQLQAFSQSTGMSFRAAKSFFQDLDKTLADTGQQSAVFGNMAKQGWMDVGNGVQQAEQKVAQSSRNMAGHINVMRIAMGVLISSLLGNFLQAITQFFTGAIDQARQFEATLYRIANAERQLSDAGIDVSVKQLKEGITDIQKALPIFSREDVSQLIGSVATTTKELGFTGDEILKLGAAISILNINSTETESLLQTQAKVTNSLISPQAKSIGNLGLAFGKANIEAKAFELGILKTGQSFEDLTEHQKSFIKYQIVLATAGIENIKNLEDLRDVIREAGGDFEALNAYLASNDAKLAENSAAWKDLQTTVGQVLIPFLPVLTDLFNTFNNGFNGLKVILIEVLSLLGTFVTVWQAVMNGNIKSLDDFTQAVKISMEDLRNEFTNEFFKEMPADAPEWFKQGYGKRIKGQPETPTGLPSVKNDDNAKELEKQAKEIQKAEDKIHNIMKEARDKRLDIERDYQDKLADISTDYSRKLADIAQDTADKREDALRDYNQKVEDINRDTSQKIQEAQQDDRQKEIDREAQFQQKLKELREKYLFDLEDALHERDARQILRLMRQYSRDKANLEDRHKLEQAEAAQTLQIRVKQLEDERKLKLEAAQREYNDKIAEIAIGEKRALAEAAIWHQRALEDARTWYNRQLRDQQTYLQRKLRDVADALGKEIQMNGSAASAVASIWSNAFASILTGFNASISGLVQPNIGSGGAVIGGSYVDAAAGWAAQAQTFVNAGLYGTHYEEGGTLLATHPQTVTFGEVPEVVSFQPLNGGNNTGRIFGDKSAMGGGSMEIVLTLSPDLEARVVNKSMDAAADVVLKVNRSKV